MEECNANFKSETLKFIEKLGAKEIDEVRILYTGCYPYKVYRDTELDWNKMAITFGMEPDNESEWNYDYGYGSETFLGWITFKDTTTYMERKEYDGSEWWESVKRPTLKDYEREDIELMKDRRSEEEKEDDWE